MIVVDGIKVVRLSEKQHRYLLSHIQWNAVSLLASEMGVSSDVVRAKIKRNRPGIYEYDIVKRLCVISNIKHFV